MKQSLSIILVLLLINNTFAQSIKKEKAKGSVLEYPRILLVGKTLKDYRFEFCAEPLSNLGQPRTVKSAAACKNMATGKAELHETLEYQFSAKSPAAFARIRDLEEKPVYVYKINEGGANYVFKNCYINEAILKSAYAKKQAEFLSECQASDRNDKLSIATRAIKEACTFNYTMENFSVYYPKSDEHNYDALREAAATAKHAYKKLENKYDNTEGQELLKQAIVTWDEALKELDTKNDEAKINKKVAIFLLENKARALGYLLDYENAVKAVNEAISYEGNFSNNRTNDRAQLANQLSERYNAYKLNKDLTIDFKKVNITLQNAGNSCHQLEIDFNVYNRSLGKQQMMDNIATASEENAYLPFVTKNGNDNYLAIPVFGAGMVGKPELAAKVSDLPEEVCSLELGHLMLKGNSLSTLPECLADMEGLRKLDVSNNSFTEIPDVLYDMKELKTLNLKGNKIPETDIQKLQKNLPDCKIKF